MSSVSLIDGHIDYPRMTTEKAIKMIDEYLLEPNSIHKDWVECLRLCRQALEQNDRQKAEIESLNAVSEICGECHKKYAAKIETTKSEAIKEFAERLKKKSQTYPYYEYGLIKAVPTEDIDNLVKEMVGDEE